MAHRPDHCPDCGHPCTSHTGPYCHHCGSDLFPPKRQNRTHYKLEQLEWRDLGNGWSEASVTLREGDTATNPASTKGPLYGPAKVTYQKAPGGIRTIVE